MNKDSVKKESAFLFAQYSDALFHVAQFDQCILMLRKHSSYVKSLTRLRRRMKKYCNFLLEFSDTNQEPLGKIAIEMIERNEKKCYELWYNNDGYCKNIKIRGRSNDPVGGGTSSDSLF